MASFVNNTTSKDIAVLLKNGNVNIGTSNLYKLYNGTKEVISVYYSNVKIWPGYSMWYQYHDITVPGGGYQNISITLPVVFQSSLWHTLKGKYVIKGDNELLYGSDGAQNAATALSHMFNNSSSVSIVAAASGSVVFTYTGGSTSSYKEINATLYKALSTTDNTTINSNADKLLLSFDASTSSTTKTATISMQSYYDESNVEHSLTSNNIVFASIQQTAAESTVVHMRWYDTDKHPISGSVSVAGDTLHLLLGIELGYSDDNSQTFYYNGNSNGNGHDTRCTIMPTTFTNDQLSISTNELPNEAGGALGVNFDLGISPYNQPQVIDDNYVPVNVVFSLNSMSNDNAEYTGYLSSEITNNGIVDSGPLMFKDPTSVSNHAIKDQQSITGINLNTSPADEYYNNHIVTSKDDLSGSDINYISIYENKVFDPVSFTLSATLNYTAYGVTFTGSI